MHLFPPPLKIGETEGFTKEKDIFGREGMGRGLTHLVTNVSDPLVIAVDGQWGSGKTIFLKMWAGELRKSGFGVVYFDAFENDYSEDALTALASELVSLAREKRKEGEPAARAFVQKAVGAGKVVLRSGLRLGVKLATVGALDAADLDKAANDIAKETSELTDRYVGELLTKQREQKEAVQSFREALAELPTLLSSASQQGGPAASRPLIIIVDELDRCRPLFALQILERIKHFFAVPGVHFVLGTHLAQLRNSVAVAYGSNIDAKTYLQKFIHLTLHLVEGSLHPYQRVTTKYIDHLLSTMQLNSREADYAKSYFRHIAAHRDLSLRTIEQIVSALAITLAYKPEKTFSPIPIIAGLCALKVIEPDLYVKAKAGVLTWDQSRVSLGFHFPPDQQDKGLMERMANFWRYSTDLNLANDDPLHKEMASMLDEYNLERRQIVSFVANAIMDRLGPT